MRRQNGSQPSSEDADAVRVLWSSDDQYCLVYQGQGEKLPMRDIMVMLMFALSLISLVPILALGREPTDSSSSLWWKTGVVYEILPFSFADGDSDGYGDLQGLVSKLPYIRDLNVTAIRLNPIFPMSSHSAYFDVVDHSDVDPRLRWSVKEFDRFVAKVHEYGLRLILDLVPNHTSASHAWFNASRKRQSPYDDFYVWHSGVKDGKGNMKPPNNWRTVEGDSAWSWDAERGEFYLHQFSDHLPDLNWRNPLVQEEFKDIMEFWMKQGVDGFFMWHINHLVEVADFTKSEPQGRAMFTQHQPETTDITSSWRETMNEFDRNSVLLLDVRDSETLMAKWTSYLEEGVMPSNTLLADEPALECGGVCVEDVVERISRASYNLPFNYTVTWALGATMLPRVATKRGVKTASALQVLQMTLPGMASTFHGEELGLTDATFPSERLLMPWKKTAKEDDKSVETQASDPQSPLLQYKQLSRLRSERAFKSNRMNTTVVNDNIYSFVRYAVGKFYPRFLVSVNVGLRESEDNYVMKVGPVKVPNNASLVFANFPINSREIVNLEKVKLKPGEGFVVKFPSNAF